MSLSRISLLCLSVSFVSVLTAAQVAARNWDFTPLAPVVDQPTHKEWAWNGERSLSLGVPAEVHYSRSGTPRIVITGSEEALRHVRVGEGHIAREDDEWHWFSGNNEKLDVTVTGVPLDRVSIGGSGTMLLGRLDQDKLDINIGGSGTIMAEGKVEHVSVNIGGSGKVDLGQVASADAHIRIGGSGNVAVAPRDEANVAIAGSGTVRMTVRPAHLHSTIAGSGHIMLADKDGKYSDAVEHEHGMARLDY